MNGILIVNKDKNCTSQDVIYDVRRILKTRKIGHGGTLDPMVTGVLPLFIGQGTKVSSFALEADKIYKGTLLFGLETSTQDLEGEVLEKTDTIPSKEEILGVFKRLSGQEIEQIPPMVSAVRHEGKRLYELDREGKTVERKARKVQIYSLKILEIKEKEVQFLAHVSKGTYIRTLVHDIGKKLKSLACLKSLERVETGPYTLEDSYTIEELEKMEDPEKALLPMDSILEELPRIDLEKKYFEDLYHGRRIPWTEKLPEVFTIYCDGEFFGLGEPDEKSSKVLKVRRRLVG